MTAGLRSDACDECLWRSTLVASLAPRIDALLDGRASLAPELLALDDESLVEAVRSVGEGKPEASPDSFDPAAVRRRLEGGGIRHVCPHAHPYPSALFRLAPPPPVLYALGELEQLRDAPAVTIVGARRASAYGLEIARDLGAGLARAGVTVVSGLALGIDAAAHVGVLERDGPAVAVLAGGVDLPYPRANTRLYRRLVATNVVASELPPGTPSMRWMFPARNRIMAALGAMTVVVECRAASGTLITATLATVLGRTVGAVPGRINVGAAAGSNALLRDGATPVLGVEDVLDELFGVGAGPDRAGSKDPADDLDAPLLDVLEAVEAGFDLDAMGAAVGLRAGELRAALGQLELEGFVVRDGLGRYERAGPGRR